MQVQRQAASITPEQRAAMSQQAGIAHGDAQRLRAEGNQLHKAGSYSAASDKYESALREIAGARIVHELHLARVIRTLTGPSCRNLKTLVDEVVAHPAHIVHPWPCSVGCNARVLLKLAAVGLM